MGVIKTNKWLEDNFYEPTTICAHFQSAFDGDKPQNIYRYLMRFGMYKPSRHSRQAFEKMKEQDTWNKLERIFSKYKKMEGTRYTHICISLSVFMERRRK
ncbi:hypothetical protein AAHH67_24605 [Niallia circulans]